MLRIRNEGGEFHIEVLQLSEIRGPAAVAQTLYRETEASKEAASSAKPPSAKPCSNTLPCPITAPPSATVAASSNSAAVDKLREPAVFDVA